MSHFSVMVIDTTGKRDLVEHMQPWHEYECTGIKDKYVVDVDRTEEARKEYAEQQERNPNYSESFIEFCKGWYGLDLAPSQEEADIEEEYKYGYVLVDEKGEVTKVIDRTNPNKKWDWWVVGGRWSGFLTLVNGNKANQAKHGDIAWQTMYDEPKLEAGQLYDEVAAAIGLNEDNTLKQPAKPWEEYLEDFHSGKATREEAIDAYHADPVNVAFAELRKKDASRNKFGLFSSVTDFHGTREEYVTRCCEANLSTYAVVKDGVWYAKGEMGWFGMSSSSDEDDRQWKNGFRDTFLADLKDDADITIIDCHI